jgi:hypothetical protein
VKRSRAAELIDHVRTELAKGTPPYVLERDLERRFGLAPFVSCTGEAHSNPHIDNCGVCLSHRWGWLGTKEPIT